ncbi:hypothetical protein ACQ4PT_060911 [Festuca glaucescens]
MAAQHLGSPTHRPLPKRATTRAREESRHPTKPRQTSCRKGTTRRRRSTKQSSRPKPPDRRSSIAMDWTSLRRAAEGGPSLTRHHRPGPPPRDPDSATARDSRRPPSPLGTRSAATADPAGGSGGGRDEVAPPGGGYGLGSPGPPEEATRESFSLSVRYESAKEIWDAVRIMDEAVREPNLSMLRREMDLFALGKHETPSGMYTRLNNLVNERKGLGCKEMTDSYVVRKMLRVMIPRNSSLVTLIREKPNFEQLTPRDVLATFLLYDVVRKESRIVSDYASPSSSKKVKISLTAQ